MTVSNGTGVSSIVPGGVSNIAGVGGDGVAAAVGGGGATLLYHLPLASNLTPAVGSPAPTFTRGGIGTYLDPNDSLIKTAATDTPRFEANGLLLEGASTNDFVHSEAIDNAFWSKLRVTITANSTAAPDGNTTADTLTSNATGESFVRQTITVTAGQTVTVSCFAKKSTADFMYFLVWDNSANGARAWFNVNTGVVGSTVPFGTGFTASKLKVQSVGNGWYRCSAVFTTAGVTSIRVRINVGDTDAVTDSAVNSAIFVWGAQHEKRDGVTSYIPTTTTSETRSADVCSVPTSGIFNEPTGTIHFQADVGITPPSEFKILSVNDGTAVDRHAVQILSGTLTPNYTIDAASVNQASITASALTLDTLTSLTATYNTNAAEFFSEGVSQGTDTSVAVPTALTTVDLGTEAGGSQFFGHIKNLRFYDGVLSSDEITALL